MKKSTVNVQEINQNRRHFLVTTVASLATISVAQLLANKTAYAEELPRLSLDERSAKALNYVHDVTSLSHPSYKEGRMCKNCNLIKGEEAEWRRCSIFPGKLVHSNGWCVAWVGRV